MGGEPMLVVDHLAKSFGALRATDDLSLAVSRGELHALIGPNGAGKSTLMKQLSGEIAPDSGRLVFEGRDITHLSAPERARLGMARSYQITSIFPDYTALENVAMAVQARLGHSFRFFRSARGDRALEGPAREVLAMVHLGDLADRPAHSLAHGQQRQLEIAMALAMQPTMLLLDEPMAGMGPEESAFIVELLSGLKGRVTMLLIEHDMEAVFSLADRITVLVYGKAIACGVPDAIRNDPTVREAYLGEELVDAA
ncbi:Branched-chain amino acid ABC transporter,ATP-binding component [Hyphomicrobiales bacterium]|nr:Branched-chain amino acid ABC transporter,ATP-binding component [Hyphomicrobiales bacterium]CAH1695307.1 Branched-chain amino acid ABC transporter,ATP-binding component [Hyphomicrobiales bacterium]